MHKAAALGSPDAIAFLREAEPATQNSTQPAAHPVLQFPFSEIVGHGDFILVPITINQKIYAFMLDTGTSVTILDPSITDLGPPTGTMRINTLDKTINTNLYHPPSLSIAGQPVPLTQVLSIDLSSIQHQAQRPITGVLGMDFLSHYIVQLDFKNRQLNFFDPATPYTGSEPSFNLGYSNHTPVIMIDFLGAPHSVVQIDTGLNDSGAVRKTLPDLLGKDAIVHRQHGVAINVTGYNDSSLFHIKKNWNLAGTSFTDLLLNPSDHNALGLEILADYIVTFDFPHDKLFLKSIQPNHPIPDPQYGIAPLLQDGNWLFLHLTDYEKSLGLQENDQLLEVDGKPVTGLPSSQLINTNAPSITLQIKRNSQTLELKIPAEP